MIVDKRDVTNEAFRRLHPKEFEKLTDVSTDVLTLDGICLGEAQVFDYGVVSVGIVDGKVVGAFVESKWRTIRSIVRSAASKLAASACAIGVDIDMFESASAELDSHPEPAGCPVDRLHKDRTGPRVMLFYPK